MTSSRTPTFHLLIRENAAGEALYEVKWTSPTRRDERGKPLQVKRRLGPAWLQLDEDGRWRKRRGRPPEGYLDERRATVAAEAKVREVEAGMTEEAQEKRRQDARQLTFREVALQWLAELETVDRVRPSTLRNYAALLREPGAQHKRGSGRSPGHIIAAFGDLDIREIRPRQIGNFLRGLDAAGMTPRNVNAYRQVLSVIWAYACREDTHDLDVNPVAKVPKRREPQPAGLDYYETFEIEALAQALAAGKHRPAQTLGRGGKPVSRTAGEIEARCEEDARDADAIRLLFFTGMRLGEIRALQWRQVALEERAIIVTRGVSAGELVETPKGGRARVVPLATPAVDVLRRQAGRPDFTGPDDFVFGDRLGGMLDDSALRRRYRAACKAAGLRPVRLHGLRHAAGSHVARRGSSVEVKDFLGHAKLSTTDRYVSAKWSPDLLARLDEAFGHSSADDTEETTAEGSA